MGGRYHARPLRTPREVRNALVYVLQNWRKHIRGVRAGHENEKAKGAHDYRRPSTSRARNVAAARFSTPTFRRMCSMCFFTVPTLESRINAISAFVFPALIGLSCLFTKQHYIIDIPAGAALGWFAFALHSSLVGG